MRLSTREELLQAVLRMQFAPLDYISWLRGVAPKKHLGEVTGLSQARLANRNQKLRPGRVREIEEHAESVLRANLADSGLQTEDVERVMNRLYRRMEAGGNWWAAFWMTLDYPMTPELTPCVDSAVQLDKLLTEVADALAADAPAAASEAFACFVSAWSAPQEVIEGIAPSDWGGASTWEAVAPLADATLQIALFDQFAHVDAVWGSAFFSRFHPRPLFPLVAPQKRDGKGVNMPVRRLLEMSWAITHWVKHRNWPAERPGPKDLAERLGVEPSLISSFLDGTTKVRLKQFEGQWEQFSLGFRLSQKVDFPLPLAAVAICWQHQMVEVSPEHKVRSAIVLGDGYGKLWRWRRSTLASPSTGTESWAAWLEA